MTRESKIKFKRIKERLEKAKKERKFLNEEIEILEEKINGNHT